MHGVSDGQFESVKHSSYVHTFVPSTPEPVQRPLVPPSHWESDEQQIVVGGGGVGHGGKPGTPISMRPGVPAPRCEGQIACVAR